MILIWTHKGRVGSVFPEIERVPAIPFAGRTDTFAGKRTVRSMESCVEMFCDV